MPPAVTPVQGSRAGFLTALVISVIIAVSMIVVAVYANQKWGQAQRDLEALQARDKPYLSEQDPTDPRVLALVAAKDNQPQFNGLTSALQVSLAETDQLAKLVGGNSSPDKAAAAAIQARDDAAKRIDELNAKKLVSFTLPKDTLTAALSTLTDQIAQLAAQKQDVESQLAAANQKSTQILAAQTDLLKQKDAAIQEANAKAAESATQAQQFKQQADAANAAIQTSGNESLKKLQDALAAMTAQAQQKEKQLAIATKERDSLKGRLHQVRVSAEEPIIQHPDGNVIRVADNKTCFINLGQRQHVTKGLTFEIYDKNKGIPPLGNGQSENGLPVGKGSIEVFNVGPDTSECRIVKLEPGEQLVIGDLIANLVYDPSVKYNFVVYGDFDLSESGAPSPTDTEIIKRLITQWGGELQPKVDLDTDFVVMGAQPVIPRITDSTDPAQQLAKQRAEARLAAYDAVVTQAAQLGVPLMNQNRFLYFTGYYDQATR
jgi:hypothetical protein